MKTNSSAKRQIRPDGPARATSSAARHNGSAGVSLKLERILVPIDFSGCSKKALQYAVSMARDYHASLVCIHVVQDRPPAGHLLQARALALNALVHQEVRGKIAVTTLVRVGEPLREIINAAKGGQIDLLLISTHARAGLPDFCLGSAAEQIVRYAPCPVLVVREQERDCLWSGRPVLDSNRRSKPRHQ
jgi:nucleotide-binding universal stress UspA family protein